MFRGVLIDQSVPDAGKILKLAEVVSFRETNLEGENFRGKVLFHNIKVEEKNLWPILGLVMETILSPGWYFHLVSNDKLYVILPNIVMSAKNNNDELLNIFEYAVHHGIHPDQLDLKKLFANPFA